jgi:hypothetical protein
MQLAAAIQLTDEKEIDLLSLIGERNCNERIPRLFDSGAVSRKDYYVTSVVEVEMLESSGKTGEYWLHR